MSQAIVELRHAETESNDLGYGGYRGSAQQIAERVRRDARLSQIEEIPGDLQQATK